MRKILMLSILCLGLLFPQYSKAGETGIYIAPKFLMSIQDSGTMSRPGALAGVGIDDYSQFTLGGALAVGYDFWVQQMIPIRLEVEFALRANSEKTWDDHGVYFDNVKGVWNNSTLFANIFWDLHNDSAFTPYIGGGIGMAFNYTGYTIADNAGNKYSLDDRQVNFAWNAGAGIAYEVNDNFAVDLSYRFVGLGYNEVKTHFNGRDYKISNNPYNNEFMVGLRFTF